MVDIFQSIFFKFLLFILSYNKIITASLHLHACLTGFVQLIIFVCFSHINYVYKKLMKSALLLMLTI